MVVVRDEDGFVCCTLMLRGEVALVEIRGKDDLLFWAGHRDDYSVIIDSG